LLALVAACTGTVDGGSGAMLPDAAGQVAGDATPLASGCGSIVAGSDVDRGRVGGSGGGKVPILGCEDRLGERIVGIAVQMSNQNTVFGGPSAQGIRIACAHVSVGTTGTATLGTLTTHDVSGDGSSGWSPSTWTPMTQCDPGWVVSGLLVHSGTTANRFLDVTITCSELLSPAGTGRTMTKKVTGSLTDATSPTQARCSANEVLTELGPFTGAGLDGVSLYCAPAVCSG
jgi:hypothetical protein